MSNNFSVSLRRILPLAMVLVMMCAMFATASGEGSEQTTAADAVSSASMFLTEAIYTEENIAEAFAIPGAAIVISTVNVDGTPNASIMLTSVVDDETIAITSGMGNQTVENINERKYAVFTIYLVDTTGAGVGEGARVVTELIEDTGAVAEKQAAYEERTGAEVDGRTLFLKVVRVLPLA